MSKMIFYKWDKDLHKSKDFLLNPCCILYIIVCLYMLLQLPSLMILDLSAHVCKYYYLFSADLVHCGCEVRGWSAMLVAWANTRRESDLPDHIGLCHASYSISKAQFSKSIESSHLWGISQHHFFSLFAWVGSLHPSQQLWPLPGRSVHLTTLFSWASQYVNSNGDIELI